MRRLKRFLVVLGMGLAGMSIWTASPLLALWVGSQVQGGGPPSMTAVVVVIAVLATTTLLLARLLSWLSAIDDRLAGRKHRLRRAPWLESMRGERAHYPGEQVNLSALERVLVVVVLLAFLAFQVWFFFFAGAPFATS